MWSPPRALSVSLSLCVSTCVFVSLTLWGHRVKTCLSVCVLIREGFLKEAELEFPRGQERA